MNFRIMLTSNWETSICDEWWRICYHLSALADRVAGGGDDGLAVMMTAAPAQNDRCSVPAMVAECNMC